MKVPPQNIEAEMSTLGSIMLHPDAISKVIDILKPEDFYNENHRHVYEAIQTLAEKSTPIDVLSVSSCLKEKKLLDKVGGNTYLTQLVNSVPTASNAEYYAQMVNKKRMLRDMIEASDYISGLGYQEDEDVETLLDEAERKIFSIVKFASRKFTHLKDALEEAWERIDLLHKSTGQLRGVPTGFTEMDKKLAGFQSSDLVILAARPSVGKTSLALDIARHAAVNEKVPVGIFSLEMSAQQIVDRLLAAEADVDLWRLRTGKLSTEGEDFARIRDALNKLSGAPIFIDDDPSSNIIQMRAKARRLHSEYNLGLLVVDYLQLMIPRRDTDSMVQQMTENSRFLKALARELNIPILAISQLSRAVEQRHPPIPRLSDLRDSGSIEQDADVVMFIYREDKYKKDSPRQNIADILIEKHRNGPTGQLELYFNPTKTSFMNLEKGFIDDDAEEFTDEPQEEFSEPKSK
jgi:replicative DNA helicase